MDISSLLKEFQRTRNRDKFVPLFSSQPEFDNLMDFLLTNRTGKLTEYGSWLCGHIVKDSPALLHPYVDDLLDLLEKEKNETLLRNWLKAIVDSKPDAVHDEKLLNLSLAFLENSDHKVALHVYSIYALFPILKRNPELFPEINAMLELKNIRPTPSFHAAYRKFQKHFKSLNN